MNAVVEEHVVHFSVDGEWLSNFCRTRVMEGAWEHALKILTENVSCTHEQAIKILKGHANLVGISGNKEGLSWKELSPVGKIAKDMDHQLDYMYGMVFKHGDKYWKPYAYVQGWGPEDFKFNREYLGSRNILGGSDRKYERRSLYYANDPGRDMLVFIDTAPDKISDVLCEETPMPPLWYSVSINRPIEHLLTLRDNDKLEIDHRGAGGEEYIGVSDIRAPAMTIPRVSDNWEKNEEAREKERELEEIRVAHAIRKQADEVGGWLELNLRSEKLPDYDPPMIRVPKNAFLCWALRGFRFEDFGKTTPEWSCISRMGWKLPMDDPFHTDWIIGAGIPLAQTYDRDGESLGAAAMSAAYEAKYNIVKEWTGVEFAILARGDESWIGGEIVHPKPNESVPAGSIAVVPSAGPDYYNAMVSACAPDAKYDRPGLIICETGGKLAHLAVVGREQKCTVLMVPGALGKYQPGDRISIDLENNTITVTL